MVYRYLDSYILSGASRNTSAKISGSDFRRGSRHGTEHGPGPGPDQGKAQILHRIPDSQARTAPDPDPGPGQEPGQTAEKHRGPRKNSWTSAYQKKNV
jgi:hypothetical protein